MRERRGAKWCWLSFKRCGEMRFVRRRVYHQSRQNKVYWSVCVLVHAKVDAKIILMVPGGICVVVTQQIRAHAIMVWHKPARVVLSTALLNV